MPGVAGAEQSNQYLFAQGSVELVPIDSGLGLHFQMKKDWHIYWKNPGDSGSAPKWDWEITGGAIKNELWPVPQRIPVSTLINLGYSESALFQFDLDDPSTVTKATVDLEFLVCKVECIPYFTKLSLDLNDKRVSRKKVPTHFIYPNSAPTKTQLVKDRFEAHTLIAQLSVPEPSEVKEVHIFPFNGGVYRAKSPALEVQDQSFQVTIDTTQDAKAADLIDSKFLIFLEYNNGKKVAAEVFLSQRKTSFILILFWAFLGGLILNIMPCVLPVLSIKILSFLGPDKNHAKLRVSGLFYTAGVVVSFIGLGGLLVLLRASGEQIGWGFQLQNPYIVCGIAILFFWLALNFLGIFEMAYSLTRVGNQKTSNDRWGSFLTGVLATIIATPCTAPFMGVALGAAILLPPLYTLLVFFCLGLGMASPFLVLAFFPQFLRLLPKPGAWMETFKQLLAFPLFATILWLIWVLNQQVGSFSIFMFLLMCLIISFWTWLAKLFRSLRYRQAFLSCGFILSFAVLYFIPMNFVQSEQRLIKDETWAPFNQTAIDAHLSQGEALFIDFTAAWCITCQVNKQLVLETAEIQNAFKKAQIHLYRADWTDKDEKITQALAAYGRNSLPLYVFYPQGSDKAEILPEVLSKNLVLEVLSKPSSSAQ